MAAKVSKNQGIKAENVTKKKAGLKKIPIFAVPFWRIDLIMYNQNRAHEP
jgi:hypothetical protein